MALTGLSPVEVIERMNELQEKLKVVDGPDHLSKEAQQNATLLFLAHLRATFASKRVLKEYKLTPEAFNWVLGEIETRFNAVSSPCSCAFLISIVPGIWSSQALASLVCHLYSISSLNLSLCPLHVYDHSSNVSSWHSCKYITTVQTTRYEHLLIEGCMAWYAGACLSW